MFKNTYLNVATKLFFHVWIRNNNSICKQSQYSDMAKERNMSDLDAINYWFNWDFNSVKRREFVKKYYTEVIKQAKEIIKDI